MATVHDEPGRRIEPDLAIELPEEPLEAVMSNETWGQVYDRLVQLISEHRTTLIFVNTRRTAERICRQLAESGGLVVLGATRRRKLRA